MKCVEPGFMTLLERALNCRSTLNPSLYIYYITNLGSRMNSEDLGPYFPPAIL
jgi:hypothetical protein